MSTSEEKIGRMERWSIFAGLLVTIAGAILAGGMWAGSVNEKLDDHSTNIQRIGSDIKDSAKQTHDDFQALSNKVDKIGGVIRREYPDDGRATTQPDKYDRIGMNR